MSWLDDGELTKGKQLLKPTTTRVTTCDGTQYIEPRPNLHNNAKSSFSSRPGNLVLGPTSSHPGYVVDDKPDLQVGFITKQLLIGSIDAASDKALLTEHKVTHILSVAPLQNYQVPTDARHLRLDILDLPDTELSQYYAEAFAFIDEAVESNGRVLIHCNAGVSRSAAITIGYLMKSRSIPYDTAWDIVKEKRPAINPNFGFIIQLKTFEQELQKNTL